MDPSVPSGAASAPGQSAATGAAEARGQEKTSEGAGQGSLPVSQVFPVEEKDPTKGVGLGPEPSPSINPPPGVSASPIQGESSQHASRGVFSPAPGQQPFTVGVANPQGMPLQGQPRSPMPALAVARLDPQGQMMVPIVNRDGGEVQPGAENLQMQLSMD